MEKTRTPYVRPSVTCYQLLNRSIFMKFSMWVALKQLSSQNFRKTGSSDSRISLKGVNTILPSCLHSPILFGPTSVRSVHINVLIPSSSQIGTLEAILYVGA